jgi:hypothetical protein
MPRRGYGVGSGGRGAWVCRGMGVVGVGVGQAGSRGRAWVALCG